MAKRELSSTLRNLKFMQRAAAAHKAENPMEEPGESEEGRVSKLDACPSGATPPLLRKCVVIMEGNPHPGSLKGRMSFQSFNPSIDKLHEAAGIHQAQSSSSNTRHHERGNSDRMDDTNASSRENASDPDLKRKQQPEMEMETPSPYKLMKSAGADADGQSSSSQEHRRGSHEAHRREKLDWNLLRPPKAANRVLLTEKLSCC